jgi:hypothetical protein
MDEQVKIVLDAVGDYVDDQIAEITAGLKDLHNQLGLPREDFEKTRGNLLTCIDDLYHRYEALSAQLQAVPADRGEEIAELRGRLLQLERMPGPAGKDGTSPDVEDVANVIILRHADRLRGEQGPVGAQGSVGATGAPGKDADPNAVADSLFERHSAELRGEPGQSVSRDEVVAELKQDQQFLQSIRGEKGDPGERGPPGKPGPPGPPGSVPDVAALIKASMAEFRQREMSEIKVVFARYA